MVVELKNLPKDIRIKLTKDKEKELWNKIRQNGGIQKYTKQKNYSATQLYNWKNKNLHLPIKLVTQVTEDAEDEITSLKGKGRSKPIKKPTIPLPENNELLTRIDTSVYNSKTPIYQTQDPDLIERFKKLLQLYGETPYKVYKREDVYELQYPGYLHKIFQQMSYETDFAALIDEKGKIENGNLKYKDKKVAITDFEGKLYSRQKRLQLALEKGDNKKVKELMVQEAEKVRQTFSSQN